MILMNFMSTFRGSHPKLSCNKDVLKDFAKFTGNQKALRPEAFNFAEKETPEQVFFYEFCKIFKNTFSSGTLPGAASVL